MEEQGKNKKTTTTLSVIPKQLMQDFHCNLLKLKLKTDIYSHIDGFDTNTLWWCTEVKL